jgi:hypothetical protein
MMPATYADIIKTLGVLTSLAVVGLWRLLVG